MRDKNNEFHEKLDALMSEYDARLFCRVIDNNIQLGFFCIDNTVTNHHKIKTLAVSPHLSSDLIYFPIEHPEYEDK